jgi:hypothetical protein
MIHKIELWINESGNTLDIYIEDIETGEYTIIDTCIVIEDDIQIEKLKETFEYLGYKVTVKKYTPED